MKNPKETLRKMVDAQWELGVNISDAQEYEQLLAAIESIQTDVVKCYDCYLEMFQFEANLVDDVEVCETDWILRGITGKDAYCILQINSHVRESGRGWQDFSSIKTTDDMARAMRFVTGDAPPDWAGRTFRIIRWDGLPILTKL